MENGIKKYVCRLWEEYKGPRTPGWWRVMNWPDTHPDEDCKGGSYMPLEDRSKCCMFCAWVPPETYYNGVDVRKNIEIYYLWRTLRCFRHGVMFLVEYLAYVDLNREHLLGSPTFSSIKQWWDSLDTKDQIIKEDRYLGMCPEQNLELLVERFFVAALSRLLHLVPSQKRERYQGV